MKTPMIMLIVGAACIAAPALGQAPGERGFQHRDENRTEVQQRAETIFQMIDANHDGIVTREEAEQAAAQFAARSGAAGRGNGQGSGRIQRLLDQAFGNARSITLQQFEAGQLARFDAMDLNHDGVVTAAEREQFRAERSAGTSGSRVAAPASSYSAPPPPPGQ